MTSLDETIREQLESDALSDALAEYARQEGQELLELNAQLAGTPGYSASKKSTRRMNRAFAKALRIAPPKSLFRRRAAILVAALLVLLLGCYASAIRSAVGNFVLSLHENSIGFSDTYSEPNKYTDFSEIPMPAYLPKGFQCMDQVSMSGVTKLFFYSPNHQEIIYCVYAESTAIDLDSEDAKIEKYQSAAQDMYILEKGEKLHLFWGKDPSFELIGPVGLRDELFKIVESIENAPDISGAEK